MSAARLAARALDLLGPPAGPVAVSAEHAPRLARALAARVPSLASGERPVAAVLVFLGGATGPPGRQTALRRLQRLLPRAAPLVLVDHNQPRTAWRRALGALALAAAGQRPARARYPAARELAALGFTVERLRLACGERIQLVLART